MIYPHIEEVHVNEDKFAKSDCRNVATISKGPIMAKAIIDIANKNVLT